MRLLVKCPMCQAEDQRVLFRLHWSKKYHEFICGHCKLEFSIKYDENKDLDKQLKDGLDRLLMKELGKTMEQLVQDVVDKMDGMDEKQMQARLDELNATYH